MTTPTCERCGREVPLHIEHVVSRDSGGRPRRTTNPCVWRAVYQHGGDSAQRLHARVLEGKQRGVG